MKIFIKNMVCNRCISAVEKVFEEQQIKTVAVELGVVETENELDPKQLKKTETALNDLGFYILEDATKKLIESIKSLIIQKIDKLDISEDFVLSKFLVDHFYKDYSGISKTFSQNENITLEQYYILQKIEKVKELLFYNEFSVTEIAGKLGYKSVQHLSTQFKNTTGFTTSEFKNLKTNHRISIDKI